MTTLQKYVLAVAASVAVSATGVQGYVRPGQLLCTSGYVVDGNSAANANNLRNPENFPVQSLVNAAFTDADTTFYLLGAPSGGSELYTEDWKLTGTEQLVRLAVENGICDSCLESGTVESGFEIELMGMVMNLYPPTLDIRDIMIRNPDVSPCREFTVTPTFSPTDKPTKAPTTSAPTTLEPTAMPVTAMPTVSPTNRPTDMPTPLPTNMPTKAPTSGAPTLKPTEAPTIAPTEAPSLRGTIAPTVNVFTEVSEFISNSNNFNNDATESNTAPFENDISTGTTDTIESTNDGSNQIEDTNNGGNNNSNNNQAPDHGDESTFGINSGPSSGRPQGKPYQPADAWAVQAGLNNLENRDYGDPFASGATAWIFTVSAAGALISLLMMA